MNSWDTLMAKAMSKGVGVILVREKSLSEKIEDIGRNIQIREKLREAGLPKYTEEDKERIVSEFLDNFNRYKNERQ